MEIQVFHYAGFILGYVKKILTFNTDGFFLKHVKQNSPKPYIEVFSLLNAKVAQGDDYCCFNIEKDGEKTYFKANNETEMKFIIEKINQKIDEVYKNNIFSKEFHIYSDEISHKVNENKFDPIATSLTMLMNCVLEFQTKISDLKRFIGGQKFNVKVNSKLNNYVDYMNELQTQMRLTYDDLVKNIYDYRDEIDPAFAEERIKNLNELAQAGYDKKGKEDNKDAKPEVKAQKQDTLERILKYNPDPLYNFTRRKDFEKKLTINPNLFQELVKAAAKSQRWLPIYFNEPIDMLQKECEKFYYSSFLDKMVEEENTEMQLLNLAAFVIGEASFNAGRTLKPFLPVLGTTYEYCDNERKFKYFGEQCFRKSHTTAFYCEGQGWIVNGDTRNQYSVVYWKGYAQMEFGSKTHVKVYNKKTKKMETFLYNRPTTLMKGIVTKKLHYDFSGEVTITNVDHPDLKLEIKFIEEKKNVPIGGFEGKLYKNDEVKYLLGGNWFQECYYTDKDGENKVTLLKIEDAKYIHNDDKDYVLPEFSYGLNQITDQLKKVLPTSDSRLRADQRLYEEGKDEESTKIKEQVESLQISRQAKLDESGKEYKPAYFVSEYDENSKDFYYKYTGDYWGERAAGKFTNNKFNCFNLDPEKEIDEA